MVSNGMVAIELIPTKSYSPTDLGSLAGLTDEVLTQSVTKGHAISSTELTASTSSISLPTGMDGVTVILSGTAGLAGYLQPGSRVDVYANITKVSTASTRGSRRDAPAAVHRAGHDQHRGPRRRRAPCRPTPTKPTSAGRTIPASETLLLRRQPEPGQDRSSSSRRTRPLSVVQTQKDTIASAGGAVHRHRPDDDRAMISRRILVISRSPALSRAIQASLGPGYQVVTSTNVIDVVDEVREQGPFDVLVAGPVFDSHAGMARLATLRAIAAVPAVVLALGPKPKASLSDIVRTGAVELIEYPTSKRQLAAALKRAFDIADVSAVGRGARRCPSWPTGVVVERPHFAEVFTVASSSGGCGKTFYATNLACYLAAQTGQRVCLVDLDLQFGEVSTALHLRPRFTISDLLSREPVDDDDLDEHVEEYLEEHELGFSVLAAPFSPADADMIAPKDVYKVMGALRRHFDYIVVDTPAQLSEIVLAAFDHSTRVLCMVTLDLPSIRNMRVFLSTLEKLRINSETIGVVLNKVEDDIGIDISDVQEVLDNKIVSVLPYSREVMKSINKGKPALVSAANSDIGKKLAGGMHQFLSGEVTPVLGTAANTAEIGESRGFWRRRKGRTTKVPELERA